MVGIEDVATRQMDEIVSRNIPDAAMRDRFMAWRATAADLRLADKEAVIAFRQSIEGLSPKQVQEAYKTFWAQRSATWTEIWRNERAGVAMMQGHPDATQMFDDIVAQTEVREVEALAEVARIVPEGEIGQPVYGY